MFWLSWFIYSLWVWLLLCYRSIIFYYGSPKCESQIQHKCDVQCNFQQLEFHKTLQLVQETANNSTKKQDMKSIRSSTESLSSIRTCCSLIKSLKEKWSRKFSVSWFSIKPRHQMSFSIGSCSSTKLWDLIKIVLLESVIFQI